MRYIIIPLIIILYLIWSYKSIKDIYKTYKRYGRFNIFKDYYLNDYSMIYLIVHIMCLVISIALCAIHFIIKYW